MAHVYEISECEEYSFQHSHGLYLNLDRALEVAKELCIASIWKEEDKTDKVSVLSASEGSYYVLIGEWTEDSFNEWLSRPEGSNYWWYRAPFNHHGAFGVFKVQVNEEVAGAPTQLPKV